MSRSAGNRRVLIVTNAFPPTMLADMQRARMLTYDLRKVGWDVDVLAPGLEYQRPIWIEQESVNLLPKKVNVHEAQPWRAGMFRGFGIGSVGLRAFWPMYRLGCEILTSKRFDLVYITTTQFIMFCLGRLWRRRFGIPYVLDFHDPWVREKHDEKITGRNLKQLVNARLARSWEGFALKHAAGLVSVSPAYLDQLEKRYPTFECLQLERRTVIPFGATKRDFEAAQICILKKLGEEETCILEVAYVGAGGSIMAKSFRRIAQTLARMRAKEPELVAKIRIRLWGTYAYWVAGEPKEMELIAQEEGVGDLVEEQPARIGYLRAINLIMHARGLLILGVDDPSYMPSKLFTYALTGNPLLACLHADSQANRYFKEMPGLGQLVHFDAGAAKEIAEDSIVRAFISDVAERRSFDRASEIAPYLSLESAQRHAELFEGCLR